MMGSKFCLMYNFVKRVEDQNTFQVVDVGVYEFFMHVPHMIILFVMSKAFSLILFRRVKEICIRCARTVKGT